MKDTVDVFQLTPPRLRRRKAIIPLAALFLLSAWPAHAFSYSGNGDTGFGGAIGNGTLNLTDDGTNIIGALNPNLAGGYMNDVLVLYIQTGPGGFADTSGFNDLNDGCRIAVSGVSSQGRSVMTFTSDFRPNFAIALSPSADSFGGLWQLANGGNNSLVYLTSVNLTPLNNSGPYSFSFPGSLIGLTPGVRSTIQIFGTYISVTGYRSTEAIAGNAIGTQGWNPFTQTAYANYTFDAGGPVIKLALGDVWEQRASGTPPSGTPPAARYCHTAVWTGSEMIVWGGTTNELYGVAVFSDGGRYNPAANTWTAVTTTGAPAGRTDHTAVWTGSEMIVWGGGYGGYNDGGRYNPAANSWTTVTTNGAPAGRGWHTAVWTGSEMIVWGGEYYNIDWQRRNDGGRYNPAANSWTTVTTNGAPAARGNHTAVWTGSEMIVWGGVGGPGGEGSTYLGDGGRYNPTANSWTPVTTTGAPSPRDGHTAVWTGSQMIVWGGYYYNGDSHSFNDGGCYSPAGNSWAAVTTNGAPSRRYLHTAVWTGSQMIVWGGTSISGPLFEPIISELNDGACYNPAADSWTAVRTNGAPAGRGCHTAVWTGSQMIVWGGYTNMSNHYDTYCYADGGRYNPTANSWTAVLGPGAPTARTGHTAVWTGSEMIVWGGYGNGGSYLNDGGRYNPAANSWTAVTTNGAPSARYSHTAVWTGSEMIVWGGYGGSALATGGRYNPAAGSWMAVATTGAPYMRYYHTAVWTGNEMIVWGGTPGGGYSYDGGRYNPTTNSWTAVTTTGAPSGRVYHTAVWTGSEMIVWGGLTTSGYTLNDGGRYNPSGNSWTAVTTSGAPAARESHTAVWTGSEMIVWGGGHNDGGRYNPTANSWTPVTTNGAPVTGLSHTAVWTGNEMIVWGGAWCNNGGRYNPAANSWIAVTTNGAPAERYSHTAVWTGNEMIVWGGAGRQRLFERYLVLLSIRTATVDCPVQPKQRRRGVAAMVLFAHPVAES